MNPIALVLAILLLLGFVPERYSHNAEEKAVALLMKVQKMQQKKTVKQANDDQADNDFSIFRSVINIKNL